MASNDESMVGKNVKENEVVRKLRNNGKIGKLVRVQNKFEGYYGSMDKSRDYYIYVYLPECTVFEIVPRNILYARKSLWNQRKRQNRQTLQRRNFYSE